MANTLGDMVVAITGDTSNFNLSIDAAGKKLDLLAQITAKSAVEMSTSFKKIDNEAKLWGNSTDLIAQKQKALKDEMTNLMNQGFDPMSAKVQSLKTQYSALGDEALALEKSQVSLKNNLKEFGSLMTGLGVGLTAGVTVPIIGMAKAAIASSAQMEMLQASFTTFLGSADQAAVLMNNLIQMAAKTPFVTTDLASGAKMLLQYGIATQDVIPDLKMLGDVSSGNTEIFNRLVYAFGQINSTGRLMGQDLRQMTEAGFNPLYIISQKTGESFQSLQKRMAAGGISAGEVAEAFKIATSEGGKFYQGMERGSLTFTGLVSTLKDNIGIMGRSISDQFIPGLKEIIKSLSGMTQWLTALNPSTKSFIVIMGAFAAAAGPVALGIGLISSAIATMDVATKSLMLTTGPVILAIGAVVALVALIGTKAAESKKQLDDLSTATSKIGTSDPAILNNALVEVNKQIQAQKDLIGLAKMRKESLAAVPDLEKKLADLEQTRIGISSTLFQVLKKGENSNLTDVQTSIEKEDEWTTKRKAAEAALTHEYALIDEKQKAAYISGEAYDAQSEKRKALLETLNKMLEQGFTVQGAGYQTILQANLDVMNGEEARYEALNRMGKEYADSQIENNAKIATAEQAQGQALEVQGQTYIDNQNRIKVAEQAKWNALNKMGQDYIDNENKTINLSLDIATTTLSVMDAIKNGINSKDPLGGLIKTIETVTASMGPEGKLVSTIMQIGTSFVDIMRSLNDDIQGILGNSTKETQDFAMNIMNINEQILNAKMQNNRDQLADDLALIDAEEQAALKAAGFKTKTAKEQLQDQLATAIKNGDLATQATLKNEIAKQTIIDTYEAKKAAAQAIADAAYKKMVHDKAVLDQKIAIAQTEIAKQESIAKLPWWDFLTGWSQRKQLDSLYTDLISAIQATPIPAAANGAIVNPTPGGTVIRVAEADQPEVIFPLDRLESFLSKGFNTNNMNTNENEGNINLVVTLDSKPFLDKIFPATKNRTVLISQGAVV